MVNWLKDRRGASSITYLLLLPMFILIIVGALQVWRLISIKQSLHLGSYRTVRCLSMYDSRGTGKTGCESLLRATLRQNELLYDDAGSDVRITYYDAQGIVIGDPTLHVRRCGEVFSMETELTLPSRVIIPYLPARTVTLHERKSSYIECPRGWAPISEGTPVTPLN